MNIDKEIDKLAKDLCAKYSPNCRGCPDCVAKDDAKTLIDKGWRKASEVAREIFEEIEKALDNSVETEHFKGTWFNYSKFKQRLAELKNEIHGGKNNERINRTAGA